MVTINQIIWTIPFLLTIYLVPIKYYERQLFLMTCVSGLYTVNMLIILRPKNMYYPLVDSVMRCRWNCLCIRRRYRSNYESNISKSNASKGSNSNGSSRSRSSNGGSNGGADGDKDLDTCKKCWSNLSNVSDLHSSHSKETRARRTAIEMSYQLTLEKVLSKQNGFELFASHLVKELSLENLLFLVEYMQLKYFVTIHLQSHVTNIGYQIPICPTLIQKYLSSHLAQANLSTSTSWAICLGINTVTRQMTELKHNSTVHALQPLIVVFDIAARDIVNLLKGDSFYRFQLSSECIRYCEELI
ncbi:hypothetical protein RFI_09360 [Reticulomyxa filosa]|uniref:RGS domain-containing protein n=1 Tax=Reticulomyxa filosa TaxID=46433 RepID=X6NPB9_RETFI|nr:hypothetical protein RFI_09360 [Reticulomyxa filosa]|eukprot:ETO27773.1 hypothetical protein RFI_09360 [Reticulomyxa filosa]